MTAGNMDKKRGIYIHMPFCVKKCRYCAFLSFDAEGSPRKEYTDALEKEIKLRAAQEKKNGTDKPVNTIYIGGGTPSVMDISSMSEMIKTVRRSFEVDPDAEFTMEANPATLGRKDGVMLAKLQAYKFMGINRFSMGVQSMDNDRLHFLGRIHTAENVARDMDMIRRKGFDNVNLDLMFSVPGESGDDALSDLEKILEFGPEHISCYSLQIEEGTPFGEMAEAGELTEVPDEEDRETYHRICRRLEDEGFQLKGRGLQTDRCFKKSKRFHADHVLRFVVKTEAVGLGVRHAVGFLAAHQLLPFTECLHDLLCYILHISAFLLSFRVSGIRCQVTVAGTRIPFSLMLL